MNPPNRDEVHFWSIDDLPIASAQSLVLSSEEREKYLRITSERVKQQYLQTRLAIRHILSLYQPNVSPAQWQFDKNAYGRPSLMGDEIDGGLVFNISHTRGALVIGFARSGELGVDVEYTRRQARAIALADRYFSPTEVEQLSALSLTEKKARFFDLWTLKEAYIKACGMGLALSLASFSYRFSAAGVDISFASERNDDADRWEFWQLRLSPSHQAAIAFSASTPARHTLLKGFRLCAWDEARPQELELIRCSERLV